MFPLKLIKLLKHKKTKINIANLQRELIIKVLSKNFIQHEMINDQVIEQNKRFLIEDWGTDFVNISN